ncbi:MAG TPA: hypothetical protein VMU34_02385 [Mycobacterium sp.]|nr:hypothetical protein [Mycobacterium sp.]
MSILSSIIGPGVVAALVSVLATLWLVRPRPNLQMVKIHPTKHVADWLARAETDEDPEAAEAMKNWQPRDIVLLTNYGDGTAYDVRLAGNNCRPRMPVVNMWRADLQDPLPMWSDRLRALGPGEPWSVVVMSSPDESRPRPMLEVSWPRWPGRGLGRNKRCCDLAKASFIETGWPGKTEHPAG